MSDFLISGQQNEPSGHSIALPLVSLQRFSELSGIQQGVLRGWVSKGYLPTYAIGKYSLINLAVLNQMALQRAPWI